MTTDLTILRKKLIYRSNYRGTREMDFLLGRFANHALSSMAEDQLIVYEYFLHNPDPEIHAWIMGAQSCSCNEFLFIIKLIREFHQIKS